MVIFLIPLTLPFSFGSHVASWLATCPKSIEACDHASSPENEPLTVEVALPAAPFDGRSNPSPDGPTFANVTVLPFSDAPPLFHEMVDVYGVEPGCRTPEQVPGSVPVLVVRLLALVIPYWPMLPPVAEHDVLLIFAVTV